jgi:universal stress protein A
MGRILCPVDFSDVTQRAVDYAIYLSRALGSRVDLLHVFSRRHGGLVPHDGSLETIGTNELRRLLDVLEAGPLLDVVGRVDWGDPATRIIEIASSEHYDLIIMARHDHVYTRDDKPRLAPGVTDRVLAEASCPVLALGRLTGDLRRLAHEPPRRSA